MAFGSLSNTAGGELAFHTYDGIYAYSNTTPLPGFPYRSEMNVNGATPSARTTILADVDGDGTDEVIAAGRPRHTPCCTC